MTEAHTITPLYQPPLTDWQRLTPAEKQDAVRRHVETDGLSYAQAAALLGCNREAIAGVVSRARKSATPIKSNSGLRNQKGVHKGKQKPKGSPNRRVKIPRRPHQGLTNLVPLGAPAEPYVPPPGAWDALPGSSPVPLAELAHGACKWAIGDRPMLFCAEPAQEGKSYCPTHCDWAYRELPSKKGSD